VNFTSKIIYIDDVKVDLTKRELELALFLFENLERLLTRSHILKVVWQHSPDVDSRKIDVYISGLRKKLMLSSSYGWELTSVYGQGYRLEWVARNDTVGRGKNTNT
jgi:DNA-binding response OmpR family regulator